MKCNHLISFFYLQVHCSASDTVDTEVGCVFCGGSDVMERTLRLSNKVI